MFCKAGNSDAPQPRHSDEVRHMTNTTAGPEVGAGLLIHEASAMLGVPAPTLRSWEGRYGMPTTLRTPGGHRRYTSEALSQLSLMRDEIVTGRRPPDAARRVRALLNDQAPAHSRITHILARSTARDADAIRAALEDSLAELGLASTLDDVVMPSMRQIGTWWESGQCDVGQEHFLTEVLRGWLAKITTLAPPVESDRWVLLGVGPRDLHTLGIEALAALLVTQGVGCRLLGSRTPVRVVVAAVAANPTAAVVIVSHVPTHRRPAIESLNAVATTGCPTYYAGNAFLFPGARKGVPGTYLGERLGEAADLIRPASPRMLRRPVLSSAEPRG